MYKRNILLASLLIILYGCQPETPKQQVIAPAAAMPSAAAVSSVPATAQPGAVHQAATEAANAAVLSLEDGTALAKKIGCFACHSIEKKLLGPAWKSVAERFNGSPDAETYLTNKIIHGGSGAWGTIAMPGYPHVSEADCRALAKWVLSLK